MEESPGTQEGDATNQADDALPDVIVIAPRGDVVLDVVFETSKQTLKLARKAAQPRPGQRLDDSRRPVLKPRLRFGYRVSLDVLKKQSKYFDNLLSDVRFQEAKDVTSALEALSLKQTSPGDLTPQDLPWVKIMDDDTASRSAGREAVFAELLRVLHGADPSWTAKNPPTLLELATMAVLADRFACNIRRLTSYVRDLRFRFPQAQLKPPREDGAPPVFVNEEAIRQKIFVSWLLDQPLKFHAGTRELILYGSIRWSPCSEHEDGSFWWDLPDGLEGELQCRRESILSCVGSVQRHFLSLYASRDRQCKLGYLSSPACDSFQLGEMVRFLANKDLLFLVDFSPASHELVADYSVRDIFSIITTLKQCPSYQIDTHHTNCGLRTRLLPILEYIQTMLSSGAVGISSKPYRDSQEAVTWAPKEVDHKGDGRRVFRFTRALSGDQRLRLEGSMAAEKLAKQLFTATEWNWTPED